MSNELKGSHILITAAFIILILPAIGWISGWLLKLAFGGMRGPWAFAFSCLMWVVSAIFFLINQLPVWFAFPFAIGFFLGIRRPDYAY